MHAFYLKGFLEAIVRVIHISESLSGGTHFRCMAHAHAHNIMSVASISGTDRAQY